MLVCMHTWVGLQVEEMIWNLLHIHSYFFIEAGFLGKGIRYCLIHQILLLAYIYEIALVNVMLFFFRVTINHF